MRILTLNKLKYIAMSFLSSAVSQSVTLPSLLYCLASPSVILADPTVTVCLHSPHILFLPLFFILECLSHFSSRYCSLFFSPLATSIILILSSDLELAYTYISNPLKRTGQSCPSCPLYISFLHTQQFKLSSTCTGKSVHMH